MKAVKDFLRDYFNLIDVPADEDGLIQFIIDKFEDLQKHYEDLLAKYEGHKYPDRNVVSNALQIIKDVLSQQKDNVALIERVLQREDNLYDAQDAMQNVEAFFKTQISVFDTAVKFEQDLRNDLDYIKKDEEANQALNTIRLITMIPSNGKYDYRRIPELNALMAKVKASHDAMLEEKRTELLEVVRQCMAEIHQALDDGNATAKTISDKADVYYEQQKEKIAETTSLALMEGFPIPMWNYRDNAVSKIEFSKRPPKPRSSQPSSDRPFHLELDEVVHLHGILHRELLGDGVGKAVDHERARLGLGAAAAHEVEDRVVGDAADRGLVAHLRGGVAHVHRGDGVGAGDVVEHVGSSPSSARGRRAGRSRPRSGTC